MSLSIKYGTYTLPIMPLWTWGIKSDIDASGRKTVTRETWTLNGYLKASGAGNINSLLTAMRTGFGTNGLDLYLLDSSGNVLQSLLAATCIKGSPYVETIGIPQPLEGLFFTNAQFSIVITGLVQETGEDSASAAADDADVAADESRWTYATDQNGKVRRTYTGKITTINGSAYAKAQAKDPGTPSGYIRSGVNITKNDADDDATFSFSDQQLWTGLPGNVTDGGYSTSTQDSGGIRTVRIAGSFTGSGAQTAAEALEPTGVHLTTRRLDPNAHTGTVSFEYVYELPVVGTQVLTETVSIRKNIYKTFYKIKAEGEPDYMQETANPDWTVTVDSEIVSYNGYATDPGHLLDETDETGSPDIRKTYVRDALGNITKWIIRWSREYHLSEESDEEPRT